MKRSLRIDILCLFFITFVVVGAYCIWMIAFLIGTYKETATEIVVTPEYSRGMQSAGYPITINRAFRASSSSGFHGDGVSLTIYRYDQSESTALLSALKTRNPDFRWSKTGAEYKPYREIKHLLPKELLPSKHAQLHAGSPAEGAPFLEYLISPSDGLFYVIKLHY